MSAIVETVEEPKGYDPEVAALLEEIGEMHLGNARATRRDDLSTWTSATYFGI